MYVRPTLEYASTVWDPHRGNKSQASLLESAENKVARFVTYDWSWSSSVTAIKSPLQWESLQERRARTCVIIFKFNLKIQYSLVAIYMTLFQHTPSTITTHGALPKFLCSLLPNPVFQKHLHPPLPLSSGTPCLRVSLLSQTLILSTGHFLWWDSVPSSPSPTSGFKSHCTCTTFILFLSALLFPCAPLFDVTKLWHYAYSTYTYRYRWCLMKVPLHGLT